MKKKILYGFIALLVVIQFFRIDKSNPAIDPTNDFIEISNPPEEIASILKTSCYDCHSNETKYPWYSNVAPVSWWLKHHIDEAREELNFSEWGTYKAKRKDHKLEEVYEEVEEGEMPLPSYLWTHGDAELSAEQQAQLVEWFKSFRNSVKEKKAPKKELHLNNGEKWEANMETTEGIEKMTAIVTEDIDDGRLSHYIAMGQKLNLEMKAIFEACTMKGEAHDQLHLYLVPLVKQFRALEEAENETDAMIIQKDILKHLNNYTNYFESI